jgi:hypothetical protein
MVVKIDENEPNIFPTIDGTDVEVRAARQEIDAVLITRIEGKPVRIKIRLGQTKARNLSAQLREALGLE